MPHVRRRVCPEFGARGIAIRDELELELRVTEKREIKVETLLVGGRGFEPLTSSVSRKRSPPELTAREAQSRAEEAGSGIEPLYGALQAPA